MTAESSIDPSTIDTVPGLAEVRDRALGLARRDWGRYDTEDLAQRAAIRYWQTFGEAERPTDLTSWLATTLRRLAIDDHRRDNGRNPDDPRPPMIPFDSAVIERALDLMASPSMVAVPRELLDRIVAKLSGRDRAIFRLRLDGLPAQTIAGRLDMTGPAVDQACARAKRRLRRTIELDPELEHDLRDTVRSWPPSVQARLSDPADG